MDRMQQRNSRLSIFVFWALVVVLCVVSYKYWNINEKYKLNLKEFDEKRYAFEMKKASLENDQKLCKEQSDALNTKFNDCQTNFQNFKTDNDHKLQTCDAQRAELEESKISSETLQARITELNGKLEKLEEQVNTCNSQRQADKQQLQQQPQQQPQQQVEKQQQQEQQQEQQQQKPVVPIQQVNNNMQNQAA